MLVTLQELSQFTIDPRAIERLPESVAREKLVLPVRFQDGTLHLIVPVQAELASNDTFEHLRFVLDCPFTYQCARAADLSPFVDFFYSAACCEISNCDARFQFQCPKQWAELDSTDDVRIRFCRVCQRRVTFCTDQAEFTQLAANNECVAFYDRENECGFMGLLE